MRLIDADILESEFGASDADIIAKEMKRCVCEENVNENY